MFNYTSVNTNNLMTLMQHTKSKDKDRREYRPGNAATTNQISLREFQNRHKEATWFTTGTIFGKGDEYISKTVIDEMIHHTGGREYCESAACKK